MSPSLQDHFERARELRPEARDRFLAELAAGDPTSAARLRELLAAAEAGDSPLDANPWTKVDEEEERAPLPERVGPYRVLSEIGRGGMGRVYLAVQEGEDFTRRLAVKIVAPEGVGSEIERRFGVERRILSALEHPGIARFHDAGRNADGRWYLALEYVEGVNLLEHAAARGLAIAERLRLFLAVLEAVAYAHARGVVHRDLKPANILVGTDGRPRLLDFGIAKLLDVGLGSVATTQTHTALRALTPAYASPEQFRGDAVTPASDVFSLGVLLYELLAGVRPFGGEATSQAALEREILHTDPAPPSTASRRTGAGAGGQARPPERGRLSRDLDAICLKALRKEPAGRYASAAELAAEIERHLAGLPVAARGDDRRYRFARFVRRHRAAVAVGGALLVAAIAIAVAVGAARGAARAAAPREPAPQPFPFSSIAGRDAAALEAQFTAAPASVATGACLAIALDKSGRLDEATLIIARLRQIPGRAEDPLIDYVEATVAQSAGQSQRALVLFGLGLERAIAGGRGELVPQIRAARGRLLYTLGRKEEAKADMESARRSFEEAKDPLSLTRVLNDLAIDELQNGRLAAGEALLEQALSTSRAAGGGGPGIITGNLGEVALHRGRPDRAEIRLRETLEAFRASKSRMRGWAQTTLAAALRDLGRPDEAATELNAAIAFLETVTSDRMLSGAVFQRGTVEIEAGELGRAEEIASALDALAKRTGDRPALAFSKRLGGELAAARDDLPAARRLLGEARRQFLDNAEGDVASETDLAWAQVELTSGEAAAARELVERLLPKDRAAIESTTTFLAAAIQVELDAQEGRRAEAARQMAALEEAAAESTSVRRKIGLLRARAALAAAEGRFEAARDDLGSAATLARSAGRVVEALDCRLESARAELAAGHPAPALEAAAAVDREAGALGLTALATRARALTNEP